MPEEKSTFPGSWSSNLDWELMSNGSPWVITAQEMEEAGVKLETVRVAAHKYAANNGFKFRTRTVNGDLFVQYVSPSEDVKE